MKSIENYMLTEAMPSYANTHSSASYAATQTQMFCRESRDLIRDAVNASSSTDVVIFAGSGAFRP
jgi:selenocysteine lyase/cysteine desulfurase